MKHTKLAKWLAVAALGAVATTTQAQQVIFTDTFESPGNLSQWTQAASQMTISTAQNHTPGGSQSALYDSSADRMTANFSQTMSNRTFKFTYWGYDDMGGQTRWYSELRSPNAGQLIGIGRFSSGFTASQQSGEFATEASNTLKYHGRCLKGDNTGWFNLTGVPDRSQGWHKFEIIGYAGDTPLNSHGVRLEYYVDGVLGRVALGASNAPINHLTIGLGLGSTAANAWFDDFKVVVDQPYILTHPTPQTLTAGDSLLLTVGAEGPNLTYQWRLNGTNIANATSATYNLPNAQPSHSGVYTVVVSNAADIAISTPVDVLVNPIIQIFTQPQSQYVNVDDSATFFVSAGGPNGVSYQWQFNGTNISGANDSTYNIEGVQTNHAGAYTVVVSDGVNPPTTSAVATLYVNRAPVLNLANVNATVGSNHVFALNLTDDYSTRGVTIMNFEDYAHGTSNVLFRAPGFSGTTANNMDTNTPNFSMVTTNLPAPNESQKALHVRWDFLANWLRLTTSGSVGRPNPTVPFNQRIRFDAYSDQMLGLVLGLRETGTTAAIGASGGTTGAIQWVGAWDTLPTPVKPILEPGTGWQTYEFDTQEHNTNSQVFSMASGGGGDQVLSSPTGKGVLEHLCLVYQFGSGTHNLYIDNVAVVPTNRLTFSLDSAPAGAQIDAVTGEIRFTPPSAGAYQFSVRATDHLGLESASTFTVNASAGAPGKITITRSGSNVTLTWDGGYTLQSSATVNTGYSDVQGAVTGHTVPASAAATFYRLRN